MSGGFARRATIFKEERERGLPTLLVDAGNFAAFNQPEPIPRTRFLYDMMAHVGYDAVTPGERELRYGLDTLKTLYAAHPEIRVVSANLHDRSGRDIFPHYTVVDRGSIRFGITGTTGVSYYADNLKQDLQTRDDFTFEDSEQALRRIVSELRDRCDVVIVLLHESVPDARRLVALVPGIDVAIAGNAPGVSSAPETIGETIFVRPGGRGQFVFSLPITLDSGTRNRVGMAGRAKSLDANVLPDPEVNAVVSRWETDYKIRNGIKGRSQPPKRTS